MEEDRTFDDSDRRAQEPMVRWITFQLGEENYGIEVKYVREILRINNIFPVPGSQSYVLGITNIRGNVVTVIDGRKRFNLASKENDDATRMIVLEAGDETIGMIVDSVTDIIDLPRSAIDINPKINVREGSEYIKGVVTTEEGLIIILNIDSFFYSETAMAVGF
jgi:purine-binding chemotaxis protein CheW